MKRNNQTSVAASLSDRPFKTKNRLSPESRTFLVTGGAGFIGSHLVERLLNDGKSIVVIDDFSTGSLENLHAVKKNPRLKIIRSKISDCKELPELVEKAEFIFHLAATVGVELVVKSALHVLETSFQRDTNSAPRRRQKFHAAAADFHLGSLWQERQAGVQRGRRFAHRAARTVALELRLLEAYGRISRARLRAREKTARHHRAAVQHRRPAPDRTLRHGAAALHRRREN